MNFQPTVAEMRPIGKGRYASLLPLFDHPSLMLAGIRRFGLVTTRIRLVPRRTSAARVPSTA